MTRGAAEAILPGMGGDDEGRRERASGHGRSGDRSGGRVSDRQRARARDRSCPECDGVIPFDGRAQVAVCPHCGAQLDERGQAAFHRVEVDDASQGDLGALVRVAALGLAVLVAAALVAWWLLR